MVAQGCSAYSRPYGASAPRARRASATDQPPFASTRTRPAGPSASRTAATRSTSSASVCPASATLTFAVVQPGKRARTPATSAAAPPGRSR